MVACHNLFFYRTFVLLKNIVSWGRRERQGEPARRRPQDFHRWQQTDGRAGRPATQRQLRAILRARAVRDPGVRPRPRADDAVRSRGRDRPDARWRAPHPADAGAPGLRHRRGPQVRAHAAHPGAGLRLPVRHAVVEPGAAVHGGSGRADARVLFRVGAGRRRRGLHPAPVHAQGHDHQPGRGQSPAGLGHVHGPRAAGRPGRARPRAGHEPDPGLRRTPSPTWRNSGACWTACAPTATPAWRRSWSRGCNRWPCPSSTAAAA